MTRFDPHRPFRVRDALAAGHTRRRVDARHFEIPFQGIRLPLHSGEDLESRCHAYMLKMRPDGAFTSVTAAALWGMPLPASVDLTRLHVSVPHGAARPRARGVVGSERDVSLQPLTRAGLRVLSATDTWMSLARSLAWNDLVAAGDTLISEVNGVPLINRSDLGAVAERSVPGAITARRALPYLDERSLSRPESLLRVLLTSAGLPRPCANWMLQSPRAMIDLAWPDIRFGIEYQGDHHRGREQYRADVARQEAVHDEGWLLMSVTAEDLFDHPGELVARARSRLESRGVSSRRIHPSKWAFPRR